MIVAEIGFGGRVGNVDFVGIGIDAYVVAVTDTAGVDHLVCVAIDDVNLAAVRRGDTHRAVAGLKLFRTRGHQTMPGAASEE